MFGDLVAFALGDSGHRLSFGKVLPEESVGVLISPALPAVMRGGEVELDRADCFDLAIPVELGPVVRRDGAHPPGMTRQQAEQGAVGLGRGPRLEFADHEVAALALDQGEHAVAALSPALAHHGVDLPMADLAPPLDTARPLPDHPFARQSPAAVVASVAFPACLARPAQMFVQCASTPQIPPDVPVDGLVADRQLSLQPQVPGDLFGAPLFPQQPFHSLPMPAPELAVAPRPITPRVGPLLRPPGSIPAVVGRRVALQFPRDRAAMAPQLARDLRRLQPHQPQRRQHAPLFSTQLPILHPHLAASFRPLPNSSFSLPSARRPCCT